MTKPGEEQPGYGLLRKKLISSRSSLISFPSPLDFMSFDESLRVFISCSSCFFSFSLSLSLSCPFHALKQQDQEMRCFVRESDKKKEESLVSLLSVSLIKPKPNLHLILLSDIKEEKGMRRKNRCRFPMKTPENEA